MANNLIALPIDYFPDPEKGRPLFNAKIYIGNVDTNPRIAANQKQVVARQENGTEVNIPQPIRTNSGGVPVLNGSVITILTSGNYSFAVDDRMDAQKYYFPNVEEEAQLSLGDIVSSIDTIALLRTTEPTEANQQIQLLGHTNSGIGGGTFWHDASDTSTIDDNGYTIVTPLGAKWKRESENNYITPLEFGALGDGSTDDIVAINRAYQFARNWSPNSSGLLDNRIGLEVKWPARKFVISAPILVTQGGIRTIGSGEYATNIECASGFTGEAAIVFDHFDSNSVFQSASIEELSIDTANQNCHGIVYKHLYDNTAIVNVLVFGIRADKQGLRVEPNPAKSDPISQTLYARQLLILKASAGTNESVYLDTLQEFTFVQCKFWNSNATSVQGSGNVINMQGCRSGNFDTCSVLSTTGFGVNIEDSGRQSTGIVLDNMNFENVTGGPVRMVSSNVASFPIVNVQIRNPRYELPSAGAYLMDGCVRCLVEASFRDVTVANTSTLNVVYTDNLTNITSSNSGNTYIANRSSAAGYLDNGSRTRVNTTQIPRTALKHQSSDNEYRFTYNFDGTTDNGYQISKVTSGNTNILQQIDGDSLFHRFFDINNNELLTLRQGNVASETSVTLRFNDGTQQQTRRIKVGAANSGPGATRLLIIDN